MSVDHRALLDEFLQEHLGISRTFSNYKLLRVRDKASHREIDLITKKMDMSLHPDKFTFQTWLSTKYSNIDDQVMLAAKEDLKEFYQYFRNTRDRLIDLDDGHYKQAGIPTI